MEDTQIEEEQLYMIEELELDSSLRLQRLKKTHGLET